MKFALGKKIKMSQIFDADGIVHPVTQISISPMEITLLREKERDGYSAVQVGYGEKSAKNKNKAFHKKDNKAYEYLKEFNVEELDEFKIGDVIDSVKVFEEGDVVEVSAISKGKGFQGVVKRHGFSGSDRTHGTKDTERRGGAIGGGLHHRVPKGKKMPGRMGGERVSVKGKRIVGVDTDNNLLLIRGSVPGRRGSLVEIRSI